MLKGYTGGAGERVEGRRCGSSEWFHFLWQGGFVLIFNEGDTPGFDATDEAFLGRMLVAPMRAKFVAAPDCVASFEEEHTFAMDKGLVAQFAGWLPALADVLVEAYDPDGLDAVPASMREWRADVVDASNAIAAWLADNVAITGRKKDVLPIKAVRKRYLADPSAADSAGLASSKEKFTEAVQAFFACKQETGAVVKSRYCWVAADQKTTTARWVVVGAQLSGRA